MNLQRKFHEEHKERRQRMAMGAARVVKTTISMLPRVEEGPLPKVLRVYGAPIGPKRPAWMDAYTPDVIREINAQTAFQSAMRARIVIEEMCLKHGVTRQDIMSARRQAKVVKARHEAIYHIKNNTSWSYPQIGRYFGKDHTSILHAVRKFEQNLRQGA